MSIEMDTQDLLGSIDGLCLVAIAHRAMGPVSRASAESIAKEHIRGHLMRFAISLQDFSGVDANSVINSMDALLAADKEEDCFATENLNMLLSLQTKRPFPSFPFLAEGRVDTVALARPYLDVAEKLLHAAVRVRMQGEQPLVATSFWAEAILFIDCMWGPCFASRAMACTIVANVASDVLVYNLDIGTRTNDSSLIARAGVVMSELREIWTPIEQYGRSPIA